MITKELIDRVLAKYEDIRKSVSLISRKYEFKDFILLSRRARDYFIEGQSIDISINGCLLDNRDKILLDNNDRVAGRLQQEYVSFLAELMRFEDEDNIVFYIIAYHYLLICKEIAYKLSISKSAPFPNEGYKLSKVAADKIKKYRDALHDIGYSGFDFFTEKDLLFYNSIFFELKCHSSATKYYSILDYYLDMRISINRYKFDDAFIQMIDLFIFRYRVVYTDKKLKQCIYDDIDEKEIISELTEY